MYFINCLDCLTWIYAYHEHRLSFSTVYQSYCIVRIYCSTVREFFPIVFFFCLKKKTNNVLDTILQLEFSVICGLRFFKLCALLSLRMTCSCISFHVVYLLNLPFRSLFIPTSPRGRQRKYFLNNIYNKLPSSFGRFLFFSIFSHSVSGVDILSNS